MLGCTTPLRTKARYASENQIVRPMDVNPYGVIHPGVGSVRPTAIRDLEMTKHLGQLRALVEHPVALAELPDDLLRGIASSS